MGPSHIHTSNFLSEDAEDIELANCGAVSLCCLEISSPVTPMGTILLSSLLPSPNALAVLTALE